MGNSIVLQELEELRLRLMKKYLPKHILAKLEAIDTTIDLLRNGQTVVELGTGSLFPSMPRETVFDKVGE